jgi:hypothetical protein
MIAVSTALGRKQAAHRPGAPDEGGCRHEVPRLLTKHYVSRGICGGVELALAGFLNAEL